MGDIHVWIVEDDPDWLRGLTACLKAKEGLSVTFATDSPAALREAIASGQGGPDVVLMDIMLGDRPEGIALAEEVVLATEARVIMLTSLEEKELILRSFQAGAIDYQIKSEFEALPDAIEAAARRRSPISPEAAERMREEFRRLKQLEHEFEMKKLQDLITPSELQLLDLVDQGYSQSQIADKLYISIRTVKNHINHILKKLQSGGSKEAARRVKEMGLFGKRDRKGGIE